MFRTLAERDGALVISNAPIWVGYVLIVIGVLLMAAFFIKRLPRREARLGALLGVILLIYAGWHLTATKITIEQRGFVVESIYGEEQRMGWLQVRSIAPVVAGAKTNPDHLVLLLRNTNEHVIDLAGLAPEERARVSTYVKTRLSHTQ